MPHYGYRCQSCEREFEVLQRMSDPAGAACPECGGAGTRLFYPTGILFKGSGFYKTDSRSTPAATPSPSAETPKTAADGSSEAAKPKPPAKDTPAPASAPTSSPAPPAAKSSAGD